MKYDYLIVGAGLAGSVAARLLADKGYRCLVIDKRNHIGGNCYDKKHIGITVHQYGPHIFHTNDEEVWNFVNKYIKFNHFRYKPMVSYKDELYSFPLNMMTFYQLWGVRTPEEAKKKINSFKLNYPDPKSIKEWVLTNLGPHIYEKFIHGYTKKQWNKDPDELPASIIQRIPVRFTFDDNYYFDKYQGIPVNGYTELFQKLLGGADVKTGASFKDYDSNIAHNIIYTGKIDEYFDYQYGRLEYRSLKFEHETLPIPDYQGTAGVNYTEYDVPYTRIIEHKHFNFTETNYTIITKEYSVDHNETNDAYYPISTSKNKQLYKAYKELADKEENVLFIGRLAEYKYYNMDDIIKQTIQTINSL